jgi:hypothetical protein
VSSTASTQASTTDDVTLADLEKQLAMLSALLGQLEQKVPSEEAKMIMAYNNSQVEASQQALDDYLNETSEYETNLNNYNSAVAANESNWAKQAADHEKEKDTTPIVTSNWWNPFDSNTKTIAGDPDAVASEIEQVAYDTTGIVVTITPSSSADDMIAQANAQVAAGTQKEMNDAYTELQQNLAQCGPIGQLLCQELQTGQALTPAELAKAMLDIFQMEMAMVELISGGGMAALLELIQLFTEQSNKAQISSAQLAASTTDNTTAMNQISAIIGRQLQAQEERSLHSLLQKQHNMEEKGKVLKLLNNIGTGVSCVLNPSSAGKFLDRKAILNGDFENIFDGKHTGAKKDLHQYQEFAHNQLGMNEKNSKLLADSVFIAANSDPLTLAVSSSSLLQSTNIIEDAVRAGVTENEHGLTRKQKEKEIRKDTLIVEVVLTVATMLSAFAGSIGGASAIMTAMSDMATATTTAAASLSTVGAETAEAVSAEIELVETAALASEEAATEAASESANMAAATSRMEDGITQMRRLTEALMILQGLSQAGMGTTAGVLQVQMGKLQKHIANKTYVYDKAKTEFEWLQNTQDLTQNTNSAAVKTDSQLIRGLQQSQTQILTNLLNWQGQAAQMMA